MTDRVGREASGKIDETQYRQDRSEYVEQYREACRSYDGAVLALAASAFGLSATIVGSIGRSAIYAMVAAWICFVTSIVSTVLSFFASQEACAQRIDELDRDYARQCEQGKMEGNERIPNGNADKYARRTILLNKVSLVTLVVGLILFSGFVAVNFVSPKEVAMSDTKDTGKVRDSGNEKVVQDADKRGYPTVRPAKRPPQPPPSTESGSGEQKK